MLRFTFSLQKDVELILIQEAGGTPDFQQPLKRHHIRPFAKYPGKVFLPREILKGTGIFRQEP